MEKTNKQIEKIFEAKRARRKEMAALPVEEKFKILLRMQKIAAPIFKSRGLKREPWRTCQFFQVRGNDMREMERVVSLQANVGGREWIKDIFDLSVAKINSGYLDFPVNSNFKTDDADFYSSEWKGLS